MFALRHNRQWNLHNSSQFGETHLQNVHSAPQARILGLRFLIAAERLEIGITSSFSFRPTCFARSTRNP